MADENVLEFVEDKSYNLKVRPLCKPDVHLKKSRQKIFDENSLRLIYSFGYQSSYGPNVCALRENIVILVAGNHLNLLNIETREESFVPSACGFGFSCATVHPSMHYFAAAEKGPKFCINIFSYPKLEIYKTLKDDLEILPTSMMQFDNNGDILVAVACDPLNKVYIWQWEFETAIFSSDDSPYPIYSLHFSTHDDNVFITSGKEHVTFWTLTAITDERDNVVQLEIAEQEELLSESPKLDSNCTVSVQDTFLSATSDGHLFLWDAEYLVFSSAKKMSLPGGKPCHKGCIHHIIIYENYVITLGSDGYMKFWDYDEIISSLTNAGKDENKEERVTDELKEGEDDDDTKIYISPKKEFLIPDAFELVYGILITDRHADVRIHSIIQDKNGLLFEVVMSTDLSDMTIRKLLFGVGSNIVGLASCAVYPFIAVASSLGNIAIYDCVDLKVFKFGTFPVSITCILWPSAELRHFATSLLIGFLDGSIRWIAFANDIEHFILKFVIKPHTNAVEHMKMNSACTILISQGLDCKLFFYSVEKFSLDPLGFYMIRHEVVDFTWLKYFASSSSEEFNETLLILCKYSYLIEIEIPDPAKFKKHEDLIESYFVENNECQVYKINGLRKYHELGDRIYDSDCEDDPDLNEAERAVLSNLKYEEKKEKREYRRSQLGLSGTENPPEVLSYLPSATSNHIWLSLGKKDFGYLFEFEFQGKFTNEAIELIPIRALEILTAEIIPILHLEYSPCGNFLFMGLEDGSLNISYLEEAFMPASGYDFAKYQFHDSEMGAVKHVKITPEGSYIASAGGDGNILVYRFNMCEEIEEYGEKPMLFDDTEVEDIAAGQLSLEDEVTHEKNKSYILMKEQRISALGKLKAEYLLLEKEESLEYIYFNKSCLLKPMDLSKELKLNPEEFGASSIAVDKCTENTKELMKEIDIQFEKDLAKSKLQYKKYFDFFKARIEHEKLSLRNDEENISLCTFRGCAVPLEIQNIHLGTTLSLSKPKAEKIFLKERRKSEKVFEEKLQLEHQLSVAKKAVIDFPSDTPISEHISKYNNRKEEYIKKLEEHIAEYKILECLEIDDKKCKETNAEIQASQFMYKGASSLDQYACEYTCTYDEKKAKTSLYYQEMHKFWKSFNALVDSVLEYQTHINEKTVIDEIVTECTMEGRSGDLNEHMFTKIGTMSEIHKGYMKIQWMQSADDNEIVIEDNIKKDGLLEIATEKLKSKESICNNFTSLLMAAKPEMNCEKKFHDTRFNIKCIELNTFKADLRREKKWLKIKKEVEGLLDGENRERSVLEEKMLVLKNKRQVEKNEWMHLYNQFHKAIGLKHKHKGYFKKVFKKKIRPPDEKEPYARHPSSESSESEQDIHSDDDTHNYDPRDVDQDLLKEVMHFRLKRHEVEKQMKAYKRGLFALSTKDSTVQRRIQRVKEALSDAWKELSSIPVNRKQLRESIYWPSVLYPEHVHKDFLGKFIISIEEQKVRIFNEMSRIHEGIAMELNPIKKLISFALVKVMDVVVKVELDDLIDIACLLFPMVDTIAVEVDEYFRKLRTPDSSERLKDEPEVEEKPYNIIEEILLAAALKAKPVTKSDSKQDTISSKTTDSTLDSLDESIGSGTAEIDFSKYLPKLIGTDVLFASETHSDTGGLLGSKKSAAKVKVSQGVEKKVLKSWRDVCDDLEVTPTEETEMTDIYISNFVSGIIPSLDSKLFVEDVCITEKDYYMPPISFEYEKKPQEITEQEDLTGDLADMLVESDITEVIEYVSRSITEEEQFIIDATQFISESFPTYPGGGLFLTLDVLLDMEREDPDNFPYSDFYQEIRGVEEIVVRPQLVHVVPRYRELILQYDMSSVCIADFILLAISDVLASLKGYHHIKTTTFECEEQIRQLEKKLSKVKRKRIITEQDLRKISRERVEEMDTKFSGVFNLDRFQDVIENPHLRIKKYEGETKLNSLKNDLTKLKASEVIALKTLDKFGYEDTLICHKLLELRNEFKFLNKTYATKLQNFPKTGKNPSGKGK